MIVDNLHLDKPKVKYGQNKLAINTILDMQSKKRLERVIINIFYNLTKYRKCQ